MIAAYGIAYAVLLVVGGRLGDAFGRRKLFLIGLASFTVTSLLCGIAPTALTLVPVLGQFLGGALVAADPAPFSWRSPWCHCCSRWRKGRC